MDTEKHTVNLRKKSDGYGAAVREFRQACLAMTQDEFAGMMGVSVGTLRNWESGSSPVPEYFMRALAVMKLDPGRAMSELGTYTGIGGGRPAWDADRDDPDPGQRHDRAMAIERLKADKGMSDAMDMADRAIAFMDNLRALDGVYASISPDQAMLLYVTCALQSMKTDMACVAEYARYRHARDKRYGGGK